MRLCDFVKHACMSRPAPNTRCVLFESMER